MPLYYDHELGAVSSCSRTCADCGQVMLDTGCDAPRCLGYRCNDCGTGCDIDLDDEGGCASALAAEGGGAYTTRMNAERAAFGLPSLED